MLIGLTLADFWVGSGCIALALMLYMLFEGWLTTVDLFILNTREGFQNRIVNQLGYDNFGRLLADACGYPRLAVMTQPALYFEPADRISVEQRLVRAQHVLAGMRMILVGVPLVLGLSILL